MGPPPLPVPAYMFPHTIQVYGENYDQGVTGGSVRTETTPRTLVCNIQYCDPEHTHDLDIGFGAGDVRSASESSTSLYDISFPSDPQITQTNRIVWAAGNIEAYAISSSASVFRGNLWRVRVRQST